MRSLRFPLVTLALRLTRIGGHTSRDSPHSLAPPSPRPSGRPKTENPGTEQLDVTVTTGP